MNLERLKESFQSAPVIPPSPKRSDWIESPSIFLNRIDSNGPRVYIDAHANRYFSVTSILSEMKRFDHLKESLQSWQNYCGKESSADLSERGAARGTAVHSSLESWIKGDPPSGLENRLYYRLWKQSVEAIHEYVHSFISSELQVCSSIGFAGTIDAVGYIRHPIHGAILPGIIDFKNYRKSKTRQEIETAFFQIALYSIALEHSEGIKTDRGLIIATNESSDKADVHYIDGVEFVRTKELALAEALRVISKLKFNEVQ